MKKLSIALLAATVLAGAASANQTGFFAGLGAVTGSTTGNYTQAPVAALAGSKRFSGTSGKTMFGGRIEAGYGMTFAGCGYASISAYATLLNTKFNLASDQENFAVATQITSLRNKYNYGVEVKLGYHFTKDTVGYVGVAAEAGKYELSWSQQNAGQTALLPAVKASKTKVYAKPVIGVRTMLTRNIYVDAKYGYGIANTLTVTAPVNTAGFLTTNASTGYKTSMKPRTHEFSVTVGWKF